MVLIFHRMLYFKHIRMHIHGDLLNPIYLPLCSLSEKMILDKGAYALSEALRVNHSLQELE